MEARTTLLVAAWVAAAAGCLADDGGDPGLTASPAASAASYQLADCHQQHLFFDVLADDVAWAAPPGFEVLTSDPAGLRATLMLFVTRCEQALVGDQTLGRTALVWTEVLVVPPNDRAGDSAHHAVPLSLDTGQPALVDLLGSWGFGHAAREARITFEHVPEPVPSTTVVVESGELASEWTTVLATSDGPFAEGAITRWAWDGETLHGALVDEQSEAANIGFGTVAYSSDGRGGAPPVTAGTAHEVAGVALTGTPVEVLA